MKKIYNKVIPFKGYKAVTIWPFIFVRKGARFTAVDERHEEIHGRQQVELLLLPFFILYFAEWVVRFLWHLNVKEAYKNLSFEKEAFAHQSDEGYLDKRRHYEEFRILFNT